MSPHELRASLGLTLVLLGSTVATAIEKPRLSLSVILSRAQQSPEELEVEAELAEARGLAAASGLGLADGLTLAVAAGARRDRRSGEDGSDAVIEAEAPLLTGGGAREALVRSLSEAEELVPAAARRKSLAELEALYAEAWAAERLENLSRSTLEAADRWLGVSRDRVREGADAPFQAELVAIERRQAELEWRAAVAARLEAWGALRARIDLPHEPEALEEPVLPGLSLSRTLSPAALVSRAVDARAQLSTAVENLALAREQSRWSVRSELAREGDEEVGRIGLGYRFPRSGELAAAEASRAARLAAIEREAELEKSRLAARFAAALAMVEEIDRIESGDADASAASVAKARAAIESLIVTGKARPSEVLPLRRQLLAAEAAEVVRRAAVASALAELSCLNAEVAP